MSWNYDDSLKRIGKHLDNMGEIEIEKLVREADLETLLTETCCREIHGAHVYADVSTFARIATESLADSNEYKRLIQGVHIYQREVSRIVETIFGGLRIHFQGRNCMHCSTDQSMTPKCWRRKPFCCCLC